jgi:biotin carboxyl carrier protein
MILVSMKMENTVSAAAPGIVTDIFVSEGELVPAAKLLLRLEGNSETTTQNAD